MNEFLRQEAMKFLESCRGREKAMPRKELEHHLRLFQPKLSERSVRLIYTSLPVCTCDEGLFVPKTCEEVLAFKDYVEKAHGPIIAARRVGIVYNYYRNLRPPTPEVQGELF